MATLEQIQLRMKKLQAQAEAIVARRAQGALDQIRDLMLKHGLTTEDIEARNKAKRERAARERAATQGKPVGAKGKLPPKYRNPKTGETWSGHARPPAWIKDVKDRSKFLINGAVAEVAVKSVGAARKVAKKAAAKKTSAKKAVTAKKAAVKKTAAKKVVAKKTAKTVNSAVKKTASAAKKAAAKQSVSTGKKRGRPSKAATAAAANGAAGAATPVAV